MPQTITACDYCKHGKATREYQYHCTNPVFRKPGKVIYPDTFKVLKKVGCQSAELIIRIGGS